MMDLPIGTVTFLFTDIEGSTQLWEQHSDAMRLALSRHNALLTHGIQQHGGVVVKSRGEGDSFFAVFSRATDAVAAALAAQLALASSGSAALERLLPSDEEGRSSAALPSAPLRLRVRMALHTGEADLHDGDYYGPAVNRCARLRAVAHGGQVLLSLASAEIVRSALPTDVHLLDLGRHRLQDLAHPEHVFQLAHPSLPAEFPSLRSLDARPQNLPVQPTPLLGREAELERLRELLRREEVRLVTLTGPGGTGKTRLALQVAADLLDDFADGVFLVELAPIRDPNLVASTIAQPLGVREASGQPLIESLKAYLREKQLLLLLDNFEQVVGAAPQIAELLAAAPRLKVLVTSRAALHLRGEQEFPVPPLAVPPVGAPLAGALPGPDGHPQGVPLQQYAAVELFIQRAVNVKPDFHVTNENAPAVAEICHRLDGLPLAIELAATRARLFSPEALLARLESRLKLLTGGARDLPARQQTLRGAIEWSYDLLEEGEQRLFRRLAVFVGGCTLEAAEAVCGGGDDVLEGIASLVEKSLVRQEAGAEGEPRLSMLETIREYGRERLGESGEAETVRQQHAEYFLALAEEAESELWTHASRLEQLETEHDNLRAALEWCAGSSPDTGLRLGGALGWFWMVRGPWAEACQRSETALAGSPGAEATVRAKALSAAGTIAADLEDHERALAWGEESLALCRQTGDKSGTAWSLAALHEADWNRGDLTRLETLAEEALSLFREIEEKPGTAFALYLNGMTALRLGRKERGVVLFEESLALSRSAGYRWLSGFTLLVLGGEYLASQPERARAILEESLAIHREFGFRYWIAHILGWLARVARSMGDEARATALYEESLAVSRELGQKRWIARALLGLASVAQAQGDLEKAWALLGEAQAVDPGNDNILMPQGHLLLEMGDYAAARSRYEEGLALRRKKEDAGFLAWALVEVGHAAWLQGEHGVTQSHAVEALGLFQNLEDKDGILASLESLAVAALAQGRKERAARLMGAVEALREAPGLPGPEWWRRPRERMGEAVRAASLEQEFAAAWAEGRAMTLEEALENAFQGGDDTPDGDR